MEYCGIDLHAEYSQIDVLDESGEMMETSRVRTSKIVPGTGVMMLPSALLLL
jgi:hypothetical protein